MLDVDAVRDRLRAGATLRMGFAGGCRVWWFEDPYGEVDDRVALAAIVGPNGGPLAEGCGDCLFGWPDNSQSWRSVYA